jgi:plasmid stabilization system protein ParE
MDFQVFVTPAAEDDLERIGRYIARDNIEAAHRFCGQLRLEAKSLKTSPRRGLIVRRNPEIRRLVFKHYLIFYKVFGSERRIDVLRFWHAARDQGRLRLREEPGNYFQQILAPKIGTWETKEQS